MKTLKKDDRSQCTSNYNLIYRMSRISQGTLNPLNFLCNGLQSIFLVQGKLHGRVTDLGFGVEQMLPRKVTIFFSTSSCALIIALCIAVTS